MEIKIVELLDRYSNKIKTVNTSNGVPRIVKDVDSIVCDLYRELYKLRDNSNAKPLLIPNEGHCS